MPKRFFAATRKGLFAFEANGGGWSHVRTSFLADPCTALLPDPRDGSLYVALKHGHFGVKLHRSSRSRRATSASASAASSCRTALLHSASLCIVSKQTATTESFCGLFLYSHLSVLK